MGPAAIVSPSIGGVADEGDVGELQGAMAMVAATTLIICSVTIFFVVIPVSLSKQRGISPDKLFSARSKISSLESRRNLEEMLLLNMLL